MCECSVSLCVYVCGCVFCVCVCMCVFCVCVCVLCACVCLTLRSEDQPRLPEPIFYYAQQDMLQQRQQGKRWTWCVFSRTHTHILHTRRHTQDTRHRVHTQHTHTINGDPAYETLLMTHRSSARPQGVVGFITKNAMNVGTSLAVYATLLKEDGKPLLFPGGMHTDTHRHTQRQETRKHTETHT